MALLKVVSIRDSALQAFMRPFFAPALGGAVRAFGDEVAKPETELAKHPGDYELWLLAEFDEESGTFVEVERRCLARGNDYVPKQVG